MKKITIAIDGYSSCGKSTLAKSLAQKLNYSYIDTGAMYRAVTLYCLNNKLIDSNENIDLEKLLEALTKIKVEFRYNPNVNFSEAFLNGENVEQLIRNMNVSDRVSKISAVKEVREKMVALQRQMGKNKAVVLDGRDIGTNVFPDAELKIFMCADNNVRAKRRADELKSKGQDISFEQVKQNLEKRDYEDMHRKENPLLKAADAIILDNTNLSREEQLDFVLKSITKLKLI